MKVTLFSTNCPRCKVLAQKLTDKGIDFNISEDVDEMIRRGFRSAPVLDVNGNSMNFSDAINWVDGREG